ncbi:hypothetical protein ABPG72_003662 [Tetrahymena utriculariae]
MNGEEQLNEQQKEYDQNIQQEQELRNQVENLEEQIDVLSEHQQNCMKQGKYIEAEMAQKKIKELKDKLEKKRKEELKQRHLNEKLGVEKAHLEEFNQFNEFWDKKMAEFNEEAKNIETELIQRQDDEYQRVSEELEKAVPFVPKDSSEVLNLMKMEEHLAKQNRYLEAHQIQQKRIQLQKEEGNGWNQQRLAKIKNQLNQLRQRQNNELNALRQRIYSGQEEQRKNRSIELERLLQKYQNVKKELEDQQQKEFLAFQRSFTSKAPTSLTISRYQQGSRFNSTLKV